MMEKEKFRKDEIMREEREMERRIKIGRRWEGVAAARRVKAEE